jgi:hypothetical protein
MIKRPEDHKKLYSEPNSMEGEIKKAEIQVGG